MTGVALGEKARLARAVAAECVSVVWRGVVARSAALLIRPTRTPDKLVIAPQDLRTSDPTRAAEIYAGRFVFEAKSVDTRGASPFLAPPPSQAWAEALHGFGWLRHLRAADTTLSRANARALVDEWIGLRGGVARGAARRPEVAARRVISWLCQSPLILDGADRAFYRRFLRSLARQTRRLARLKLRTEDGLPRLTVACALVYAGLCLAGETRLLKTASKQLADELDRQILADGGHVSRNPAAIVEVLLDLLPLRQAFAVRGVAPPQGLLNAIDRAMPMLRFFRHGDGAFAQFNGAGPSRNDLVATVLAYDDARGPVMEEAPHSGYQRLVAGDTLALEDVGAPPPRGVSRFAHAGCLSFELSHGSERIVVNCGAPEIGREAWDAAARATAAHSTAVINDTSSCRFVTAPWLRRFIGPLILAGPSRPQVKRQREPGFVRVTARHDGYARRFGVDHERALRLSDDGLTLEGEDRFLPVRVGPQPEDRKVALRFHLHPAIRAAPAQDGQSVLLSAASGAGWLFSSPDAVAEVEESVHLSGAHGPRRAEQIVVRGTLRGTPSLGWSLRRIERGPGRRARMPSGAEAGELFGPDMPLLS